MKAKQKQWLIYIVISAITVVGLFLITPTLSEIISIRIPVLFISGVVLLFPSIVIIGLIKEKVINKKWYMVIILLLFIFAGILFKIYTLSEQELHNRIKKIEPINLLSS